MEQIWIASCRSSKNFLKWSVYYLALLWKQCFSLVICSWKFRQDRVPGFLKKKTHTHTRESLPVGNFKTWSLNKKRQGKWRYQAMEKRKGRGDFGKYLRLIILYQIILIQPELLLLAYTLRKLCPILIRSCPITVHLYQSPVTIYMFTNAWLFVKTEGFLYVETQQNY